MADMSRRAALRISLSLGAGAVVAGGAYAFGTKELSALDEQLTTVNAVRQGVASTGEVDIRAAVQALVDNFAGGRTIRFPAGRYRIGTAGQTGPNRITLPSQTHIVCDPGAIFEVNAVDEQGGTSIFYASGHDGDKEYLTFDAISGSREIVLPAGRGRTFSIGDLVGMESSKIVALPFDGSEDPAALGGGPGRARELRQIESISEDVLTVDIALEYDYLTTDGAQFWLITPVRDVVLEGMTFEPGPGVRPGFDSSYAIQVRKSLDCRLEGITLRNMIGGVQLFDAYGTRVNGLDGDGLPKEDSAAGYVLLAAGSTTKLVVDGLRGRGNRHLFTTLADQRGGDPFYVSWGGPMFVEINGAFGVGGFNQATAVFDTHSYGRHIHFNDCAVYGGGPLCAGFQMRAQYIEINNCQAYRCGRQGVVLVKSSENVRITGGEFAYGKTLGMLIDGKGHHVSGANVHSNARAGIGYFYDTCVGLLIEDCVISENQYGLHDGGATNGSSGTTVRGCKIPRSESQVISILNTSGTSVVEDCALTGYGPGADGTQGAEPGAQFINNSTDVD